MNHRAKGREGEDLAVSFLEEKDYKILKRNFMSRTGEVDIICRTNNEIAFIEVKYWDYYDFEDLEYAINSTKRKRIVDTSRYFLVKYQQYRDFRLRYDVVFLSRRTGEIHHLINAF
ncbi:MAG: YraN family protein [Spirochaetales bacterium]|nr:YraN family protein [Spirochaetales bacterium]